jgi:hypothetical protein
LRVLDIIKRLVELEETVLELKRWLAQSRIPKLVAPPSPAVIPKPVWQDTIPLPASWEDTELTPSAWTELFPTSTHSTKAPP